MSDRLSRGSDVGFERERDDDEQSIIDVFEFDDTTQDRWLCSLGNSRRNSIEERVEDLDAWLHADLPESETSQAESGTRRSVDTRTFTRIKRRLNLDNNASVSPESMPFSLSNVWKNQATISENPTQEQNAQREKRDSIPMMLRPKTNQVLAALMSESPTSISSQTSMEAFRNMACSKEEINSFISDISDPDINNILMNISQPSLLYSSMLSDGEELESIHAAAMNSFVDSQILTDSMMEASMFKEVQDTSMLAEFLKQNDCTVIEDTTFCKSSNGLDADQTFVSENFGDTTFVNLPDQYEKSSNHTVENLKVDSSTNSLLPKNKNNINSTKIISSQDNLLNITRNINTPNPMNSTKTILNSNVLSTTHTIDSENKTDLTFELKSTSRTSSGEHLDITFEISNFPPDSISRVSESATNPLNSTFNAIPNLRAELLQEVRRSSSNKFDVTFTNAPVTNADKLNVTYDHPNSADSLDNAEALDATYKQVPSLYQSESQNVKNNLDLTYDATHINSKISNVAGTRRLGITKKPLVESQLPATDPNRFNTFRKDSKIGSRLSKMPYTLENQPNHPTAAPSQSHVASVKNEGNLNPERFNTFSKRMSTVKNIVDQNKNTEENKQEPKFSKPLVKLPRQIQAPRQLTRLPQLFQKSNPNLGVTLKSNNARLTINPDTTFNKGSQPNICNMHTLGRFKSEQRLVRVKQSSECVMSDGTSRSMESIESTASAHSAPDLDDRLSTCSDNSRASYTIKPRSIETLKKIGSLEEKSGKNWSTPKLKGHQILENTWVEEKNLPSPILKNGENIDSRSTSPSESVEYNAKTSSPLTISPASSDQAIHGMENDDGGIEATKENIQATQNVRPKQLKVPNAISTTNATKLRQPTNWKSAPNKVANGGAVSGIPRPASRIPAPKFARPNLK